MRNECVERAFELARSGKYDSVMAVAKQLVAEGFKTIHDITGGALTQAIGATVRTARCGPVPVIKPHVRPTLQAPFAVAGQAPAALRFLKAS